MVTLIRVLLSSLAITSSPSLNTRLEFIQSLVGLNALVASNDNTKEDDLQSQAQQIRRQISHLLDQDAALAGPFVRLAFHDAVCIDGTRSGGPNASIRYELDRPENRALSKPLAALLEPKESSSLSLADVIALAGSEAVHHANGSLIPIRLGRVDASVPDPERVSKIPRNPLLTKTLPNAGLGSDGLRQYFARVGLSEAEFVALSGSHGMGRHVSLLGMSKSCLRNLTRTCLEEAPVLLPFVTSSVDNFDNSYFYYLLKWYNREIELGQVAFIPTDVALVVDAGLRRHVERFAKHQDDYFRTFTTAYQKLVERGTITSRDRY